MTALLDLLRARAERTGPATVFGLLRVGLTLIVWSEWGADMQLFRDHTPHDMALAVAFWAVTVPMFLGLFTRAAAIGTAALMLWMYFGEGHLFGNHDWVHHHSWMIMSCTACLALAPIDRHWSIDAWRARRRGESVETTAPLWVADVIGAQVSASYFWGAFDKSYAGFLSGERMQHHFHALFWGSDIPGAWFEPTMMALAVGTVALEYALPVLLFWPRTRWWGIGAGLALHAGFYVLLPVGTFSVAMMLLYLVFVPPEDIDAFVTNR
jgi:hypothetical protein